MPRKSKAVATVKKTSVQVIPNGNYGYADVLNTGRADRYKQLMQYEKDLLNGVEEIGLLKAMMYELVKKLDTFEAGKHWKQASQAYADFNKAMKMGSHDPQKSAFDMEIALGELEEALRGGNDYYTTLEEIQKLAKVVSALRDRELKRVTAQSNALTVAVAQVWLAEIGRIHREEIDDDELRKRIADRLREATKLAFQAAAQAGSGD